MSDEANRSSATYQRLRAAILEHEQRHSYAPTVQQIAQAVGMAPLDTAALLDAAPPLAGIRRIYSGAGPVVYTAVETGTGIEDEL